MEIINKQAKEIYARWEDIFNCQENNLESRLKAFSILKVIEALVYIYEEKAVIGSEEIDDLFIAWNKECRPLLKEEIPDFLNNLKKEMHNLKYRDGKEEL